MGWILILLNRYKLLIYSKLQKLILSFSQNTKAFNVFLLYTVTTFLRRGIAHHPPSSLFPYTNINTQNEICFVSKENLLPVGYSFEVFLVIFSGVEETYVCFTQTGHRTKLCNIPRERENWPTLMIVLPNCHISNYEHCTHPSHHVCLLRQMRGTVLINQREGSPLPRETLIILWRQSLHWSITKWFEKLCRSFESI